MNHKFQIIEKPHKHRKFKLQNEIKNPKNREKKKKAHTWESKVPKTEFAFSGRLEELWCIWSKQQTKRVEKLKKLRNLELLIDVFRSNLTSHHHHHHHHACLVSNISTPWSSVLPSLFIRRRCILKIWYCIWVISGGEKDTWRQPISSSWLKFSSFVGILLWFPDLIWIGWDWIWILGEVIRGGLVLLTDD